MGGDRGVLSGLDAADADSCEQEPAHQDLPVGRAVREAEIGNAERSDTNDQHACRVRAVTVPAGGKACDGGGRVIGDVQGERDRGHLVFARRRTRRPWRVTA